LADEAVSFDAASLERLLKDFVVAEGVQIGQIIHALRVAVTGKSVGFGLFESLEILGRQRCLARIGRALELGALRTPSPPSSGERAG
jgi:glutamyl-tRNA synthetase